jgi:hypothetical protein
VPAAVHHEALAARAKARTATGGGPNKVEFVDDITASTRAPRFLCPLNAMAIDPIDAALTDPLAASDSRAPGAARSSDAAERLRRRPACWCAAARFSATLGGASRPTPRPGGDKRFARSRPDTFRQRRKASADEWMKAMSVPRPSVISESRVRRTGSVRRSPPHRHHDCPKPPSGAVPADDAVYHRSSRAPRRPRRRVDPPPRCGKAPTTWRACSVDTAPCLSE